MKRRTLYLTVALLTFSIGMLAWFINPLRWIRPLHIEQLPPVETPCAEVTFTVADQPQATARLRLVNASCQESHWNAQLTLENTGEKVISGYEIANVETYQYKRDVESSYAENGHKYPLLRPGESKSLGRGGGFRDGLSYGRPVGPIRQVLFWVKRIQYTDGSEWPQDNQE